MSYPKIYIIGAGAIGKALAVFLTLQKKEVILIRGRVDNTPTKHETIRIELPDKAVLEALIEVSTLSNFKNLTGIVVLTNKSFGNGDLARALHGKINCSPLVVLQNGLGVEQPFIDRDFPEIYRCVLFATSQNISENSIRFKPVAVSAIGTISSKDTQLDEIVGTLDSPNFRFMAETEIQKIIWRKAIANSVFNSVCPLLEVDNGIFHRDETARVIAERVIAECVAIAAEKGIVLEKESVLETLLSISRSSDGQLISTLQDIKNNRPTEIETLNFAIVDIAKGLGKEALVTETKLLGELTKLKSELGMRTQQG